MSKTTTIPAPASRLKSALAARIKFTYARPRPHLPQVIDRDWFDGASVSAADIRLWLETVPGLDPDSPRADWYVRAYAVPAKIRAAKLSGRWPPAK